MKTLTSVSLNAIERFWVPTVTSIVPIFFFFKATSVTFSMFSHHSLWARCRRPWCSRIGRPGWSRSLWCGRCWTPWCETCPQFARWWSSGCRVRPTYASWRWCLEKCDKLLLLDGQQQSATIQKRGIARFGPPPPPTPLVDSPSCSMNLS